MHVRRYRMDDLAARIVPTPYTMAGLTARAGEILGMRLIVLPKVRRGTPLTGMVVREGDRGIILVPDDATEEFQIHILAHELWHLAQGHHCTQQQLVGYRATMKARLQEAMCERFARKVGLEIKRQRAGTTMPMPDAARGLAEAFGTV
ncbi:hypothetical protein ACFXHA_33730 [Nocardia sp. NPDC059240]|uniref:hypothetical protein n=1 Tax=Nocardia sp. NPDC059240 TaxID=3346786 RepID=UPI0036ABE2AB